MNDTTQYQARLEAMLKEVTEELKTVGIHNPENTQDWVAIPEGVDAEEPDENISADAVEEWDERQALVADLEPRYNSIVAALKRITDGTYGTCAMCGEAIESRRLDANPAAKTCIAHKEEESNL